MRAVVLSPLTVDELKERIEANTVKIRRLRQIVFDAPDSDAITAEIGRVKERNTRLRRMIVNKGGQP